MTDQRVRRPEQTEGVTGQPWTTAEIELTVAAYLRMLEMQVAGQHFTKAQVVRQLQQLMPARNSRAIEAKFQNISAVLEEAGIAWIDGYKPLAHYQQALKERLLDMVDRRSSVRESIAAYENSALVAPSSRSRATEDVLVPIPSSSAAERRRSAVLLTGGRISALHDFRARKLGDAGERWVVELEREGLRRASRADLAGQVTWASRELGDGLGYDVASFRPDGRERLIEVKTTNYGPRTPFYITRWEVAVSRDRANDYSLYRVHGFARDPRIYVLDGDVEQNARLDPAVFLGIPIG